MSEASRRAASKIGRATAAKVNRVPPDHDDYVNACALIVDAAIARAVEGERALLNEFMDATERVMEIAGKLDSDVWYRLTRVRQKTSELAALRAPWEKA